MIMEMEIGISRACVDSGNNNCSGGDSRFRNNVGRDDSDGNHDYS